MLLKYITNMKNIQLVLFGFIIFCLSCNSNDKNRTYPKKNSNNIESSFGTGLEFNQSKYEKTPIKANLTRSLYSSLPESFSLKEHCPLPYSQGQYGTCVGWAASNARTILYSINNNLSGENEITEHRFSPGFIYYLIRSSHENCTSGTYIEDAVELLKEKGVPKYKNLDSKCPSVIQNNQITEASKFKIENYTRLFNINSTNKFKISRMKKSLSEGNPVVIGMNTPPSFFKAKYVWTPVESFSQNYGGHAMCLIGYDNNKYGGAFEVMNSWGEHWGNKGFMYIKYNDLANFIHSGFELIDDVEQIQEHHEFELDGEVEIVLKSGDNIDVIQYSARGLKIVNNETNNNVYKSVKSYTSGTMFRLYLKNTKSAYVYAIATDNTNIITKIFPYNANVSPILNYSQNIVPLPDEEHFIKMDNNLGTDVFCLLYSKKQLDIDQVIHDLMGLQGTLYNKIHQLFGESIIPNKDINFENNIVKFYAKSSKGSIVPVLIELNHK